MRVTLHDTEWYPVTVIDDHDEGFDVDIPDEVLVEWERVQKEFTEIQCVLNKYDKVQREQK